MIAGSESKKKEGFVACCKFDGIYVDQLSTVQVRWTATENVLYVLYYIRSSMDERRFVNRYTSNGITLYVV